MESAPFIDYYEVLQVSANADGDTIHRVYRMLAQRFHPDNQETGNAETFKKLVTAYRVLSNPEERAAYDVQHRTTRKVWWKIFNQREEAQGVEAERRKRHGILGILYRKRMLQPEQPGLTIQEMEELLACPREHLEFSLWYLKESQSIQRTDNGRYFVTFKGVEQAESKPVFEPGIRMLPAAGRSIYAV